MKKDSPYTLTLPVVQPWGLLQGVGDEYIVKRHYEGADYVVFLDFSDYHYAQCEEANDSLDALFEKRNSSSLSFSGWVGFWTYDFLAAHVGVSCQRDTTAGLPDGLFVRPQTLIRFESDKTVIESLLPGRSEALGALPVADIPSALSSNVSPLGCNLDYPAYEKIFNAAREEILKGNTYQIKISQRYEVVAKIDPLSVFTQLLDTNPAPEAFLMRFKSFSLISCSPEVVIDKVGDRITTRPIGGTWEKREGVTSEECKRLFRGNAKEVAEHNMLVDLERNDLSRICSPGTVAIERFQEIETYAYLYHLVTTISGQLRESVSGRDIIEAMLPGGSITGCPKIKTMELIDALEPQARGAYTGSFGLIHDRGDMHLNLIIRTILCLESTCCVQAGGGIVVDSTAKYEYNENRIKAKALLDAFFK